MSHEEKPEIAARDYREFLADSLEKRRQNLLENYRLVMNRPEPDPVHDLRVSIRRFSALLSILQKLGQSGRSEARRDLNRLMTPLGKLRDIQVRIEWIEKFSRKNEEICEKLVQSLREEENRLISAVPEGLKTVSLDRIAGWHADVFIQPVDEFLAQRGGRLSEICSDQLFALMERFAEKAAKFNETGDIADMHSARIALKKFRYTIEIFLPYYPKFNNKELNAFQTGLGNIRDLDLLIEWLKRIMDDRDGEERDCLQRLLDTVTASRNRRYKKVEKDLKGDKKLVQKWRNQMKKGKGEKKKSRLKEIRPEVVSLCERFDPDPPHAKYVSELALGLFDELTKLGMLDLGDRYRTLLDFGCLLHDIGWVDGQQQHHKRSFEMIVASDLPLGRQNKLIVALIARFHRKADPDKKGSYHTLQPKNRAAIGKLAAIIRIADVLDRLHDQATKIAGVQLENDLLTIVVSPGSLKNIPGNAIEKKIAFFPKAYGMPATIVEGQ